jgi:sporulation protein YqfC
LDKKDELLRSVAGFLEIPKDLILDEAKLTVFGREEAVLENHRGIIEYSTERVGISFPRGAVEIVGEDLVIKSLYPEELKIVGWIKGISFTD